MDNVVWTLSVDDDDNDNFQQSKKLTREYSKAD